MYGSLLGSVLQEALDAMTKEKARLKADMEFLQRQLDLVAQQADQVQADAETRPAGIASEVSCSLLMPLLWHPGKHALDFQKLVCICCGIALHASSSTSVDTTACLACAIIQHCSC